MKDLYGRNALTPYEADIDALKAVLDGFGADQEAARFVLLHPGRKDIYDRTHATLRLIGQLRGALELNETSLWIEEDFTVWGKPEPKPEASSPIWPKNREVAALFIAPLRLAANYVSLLIVFLVGVVIIYGDLSSNKPSSIPRVPVSEAQPSDSAPPASQGIIRQRQTAYVTAERLNVRASPSIQAPVVAKLSRYATVRVDPDGGGAGWSKILFDGSSGFVDQRYLVGGDGEKAKLDDCRRAGIRRPKSGEVLSQLEEGEHSLRVQAGNNDAVIKLKDRTGSTVFSMYVRDGEVAQVNSIPDGIFKFMYATGRGYSDNCGIFVEDMYAASADDYTVFEKDYVQGGYYTTSAQYTLYEVVGGNFRPRSIDVNQF